MDHYASSPWWPGACIDLWARSQCLVPIPVREIHMTRVSVKNLAVVLVALVISGPASAQPTADQWHGWIDAQTESLFDEVVTWRRHFHANPELSNREFETAEYVAEFLRGLGMEVPVSHACGHDTHMAMLMGVAEMFAARRDELPGSIKFIFQPAEEGAPRGEEGGAELMVKQGVLSNPDVDVIFGQHIWSLAPVGRIGFRSGGIMAAADQFRIVVNGKQTHGSTPWTGVDPVAVASQIVIGLNMIISRQTELTKEAAVISVARVRAGVRNNIIPETAELIGTIRTLDTDMQDKIHADIRRTVDHIAKSFGATAEVDIQRGYPVTFNDPELTERMRPTLERVGGVNTMRVDAITGAEDFSFFQKEIPGLYFFVGGMPADQNPSEAAPHHTPDFYIEESGMKTGVRALANLTIDFMLQTE